ncbi:MAG: CDP-alcohol phosphatidyltransferase family protein [Nanoarchaeota archaeon]
MDVVEKFRAYRSKKLEKIGKSLVKIGISANQVTALAFLSGLAAVYFLFSNYYLFIIFALLHLCFDGMDGVIARLTKPTTAGKYFDLLSDSTVTFIAILKVAWLLQEFYVYITAGLFLAALFIHLVSTLRAPMFFLRTPTIIILLIAVNPSFPMTAATLTAGYLAAGGTSLFSLARQLQWYVGKR